MPATALADGPFEPNETAAMVTAPVTVPSLTAALETPQDVDWYLLRPQGVRQIGILGTLNGTCPSNSGYILASVKDADAIASYEVDLGSVKAGYDYNVEGSRDTPKTADQVAFTSKVGHRYLVKVSQSGCQGA